MRLHGRIVVVTGASSGIGAATGRELAKRGATVVLAARRADELRALAAEINQAGGRAQAIPTDVARRDSIDHLIEQVIAGYGRVDVLVNNAGVSAGGSVADSDDASMQRIVDINLLGPARCIQAVLPHMRRQGAGVIVNVGSVAGELGTSGLYSATKFGLRGLNDALRRSLRRDNIAVVLVVPGFIRTAMTAGAPIPMPGPEAVARAIGDAIERPRRKVIVPWVYGPLVLLGKLLPPLTDRLFGSRPFQRHYHQRKPTR